MIANAMKLPAAVRGVLRLQSRGTTARHESTAVTAADFSMRETFERLLVKTPLPFKPPEPGTSHADAPGVSMPPQRHEATQPKETLQSRITNKQIFNALEGASFTPPGDALLPRLHLNSEMQPVPFDEEPNDRNAPALITPATEPKHALGDASAPSSTRDNGLLSDWQALLETNCRHHLRLSVGLPAAQPQTAPNPPRNLSDLLETHVRQLLVSEHTAAVAAASPLNGTTSGTASTVMLRMREDLLPGTDFTISKTPQGWSLKAVSNCPQTRALLRRSLPQLAGRFQSRQLGELSHDCLAPDDHD